MWGCILWRPRFTDFLHESLEGEGPHDFATILNSAARAGLALRAAKIPGGSYLDVGTYDDLERLDREYRSSSTP
jgi:glucose-1-phosphate thymidylyltransferase